MDRKRDELAAKLAAMNNREFLVALTNMGEYKRALKDFEQNSYAVSFADGTFRVIGGEATVVLGEQASEFTCSCPSPIKCRHMLTAIMAVATQVAAAPDMQSATDTLSYTQADMDGMKKLFGAKTVSSCARKYGGSQFSIQRGEQLVCTVNGSKVVFLPGGSVESAVCSCKKAMCEHKCLALMKLYAERTGTDIVPENPGLDERTLRLIDECLILLARLLQKGFYAATPGDGELAMFYSLNLSLSSQVLGRHLRSLSLTIDDILQNAIYADIDKLCYHYCKAVNLLNVCKANADKGELLSRVLDSHKSVYICVPVRDFVSLGSYPFIADSGYAGVTHILYDSETGLSAGLTAVLPTIYGDGTDETILDCVKKLHLSVFPHVEGRKLRLYRFKEGNHSNLTVTDDTSAEVTGELSRGDYAVLIRNGADYSALKTQSRVTDYLDSSHTKNFLILPFDSISAIFDETEGKTVVELIKGKQTLYAFCPYTAVTKTAASRLERIKSDGFAVITQYGGEYMLLTLFCNGKYVDLYF